MRRQVLFASAALAAAALAVLGAGLWLAARRAPEAAPALATAGLVAGFGLLLLVALAWLLLDERIARPSSRLAAALRARAHGGVTGPLDTTDVRHLGDLGPAAAAVCDRLVAERADNARRIQEATRTIADERARLAAILSEVPVAVMVVDARHRVALYDRQCVHVLGHVATLCLDRSVFEYLERVPLEAALEALRAEGSPKFVDTDLPTADGLGSVQARLRLSGARGYVLTMEVDDEVIAERPLVFDFTLTDRETAPALDDTPLSALTYVVFDTETTGLDPASDEIVQIGAVRAVNGRLVPGEVFDSLVDPGRLIPPGSSRIHGITDELVAGAPDAPTAVRQFHGFARDAVLVAHNAPFDLAFLNRHAGFDNPVLDTVLLSAAIFGEAETHTLDAIADRLGVQIDAAARHTAMGDAYATANVLLRLIPILEAKGIRTFGETVAAMRRHQRLLPVVESSAAAW